jgi:hypothetical protein
MNAFHWTCPYCDRDTTITDSNYEISGFSLGKDSVDGRRSFRAHKIVCPNPKCRKFTFELAMFKYEFSKISSQWEETDFIQSWKLLPPSAAKVFPDYVPQPIRDDYLDACQIRDLSPKASATLSRRCLQGMIREFWGVKKARLIDEIEAIKDKTDALTWEAIDAVGRSATSALTWRRTST